VKRGRNAVAFITAAIEKEVSSTFNVGTGKSVTINRLADVILRVMGGKDLEPLYEDPRAGDILHSRAEMSRPVKALGLKLWVTLEEGLRKTISISVGAALPLLGAQELHVFSELFLPSLSHKI